MATLSVMPSDKQPGKLSLLRAQSQDVVKAIYVTPNAVSDEWLRVVRDAVALAGLRPVTSLGVPGRADENCVLVTGDIRQVPPSGLVDLTIVQTIPFAPRRTEGSGEDYGLKELEEIAFQMARATEAVALNKRWVRVGADDSFMYEGVRCRLPDAAKKHPVATPTELRTLDFYRHGAPATGATAQWQPDVFIFDNRAMAKAQAPNAIDTTGRPRYLMYGPYICLPPGRWQASAVISLNAGAERHRLRLEWGTSTLYETFFPAFDRAGVYEITMSYDWVSSQPADFRVILLDSSLSGSFIFHHLSVSLA